MTYSRIVEEDQGKAGVLQTSLPGEYLGITCETTLF